MAITASTISSTQTLEEFRLEFNKLRSDVSSLESNPTYGTSITFEGATDDDFETTLTITDPTADRTITLPNATGTVLLSGTAFDIDDLDINGGTDIGAAIVDADLFIIDDGAGGTNRKTAASRFKTYIGAPSLTGSTNNTVTTVTGASAIQGEANLTFDGSVLAATGNITATGTIEPAGDTAAGDSAAIGYTSAEGLILTGQGSTNDVTIKNDADADVIKIPTGTTNVTIVGDLTVTGDDLYMGTNTSGAALIADGTNFNPVVISGDISINTSGVAAIGSGVIVVADMAANSVDSAQYVDGSIDTVHIADDQITLAKMAGGTDGNLITYDASGDPAAVATGSSGQVLTSAGAGAAPTFQTAPPIGLHTIWMPAVAMRPTSSNGCATITDVETTSGRPDLQVLDFDTSSDEHAQFQVGFPKSWNEGTVTFRVFWTSTATDTDGVAWGLQGVSVANDGTIDVAYGTAVVVTDDNISAAEDCLVTATSGAVTIASAAADTLTFFRIFRDISDGNDDMAEDARLIGVQIFFTTDAVNDA